MPDNTKFFAEILAHAQKHHDKELSSKSGSFLSSFFSAAKPEESSQATKDFMAELNKYVIWGTGSSPAILKTGAENTHAIVLALCKYCISRKKDEKNELYDAIMKDLVNSYSVDRKNYATFYSEISAVFKDFVQQNSSNLPLMSVFILDINTLLDHLLSGDHKEADKATILVESKFIENLLPAGLNAQENFVLSFPVIKKALAQKYDLGLKILKIVPTAWWDLLKIDAIATNAQVNNLNFMQDWHNTRAPAAAPVTGVVLSFSSPWLAFPSADFIRTMLANEIAIMKDLNATQKQELLSLPCNNEGHTPLQALAYAYVKATNGEMKQDILNLIKQLLDANVSVAQEKQPLWLEILIPHIQDPDIWTRQIKLAIPARMWSEFYTTGLHVRLAKVFAEKMQQEDFWTRPFEAHAATEEFLLGDIRKEIIIHKPANVTLVNIPEPEKTIITVADKNKALLIDYTNQDMNLDVKESPTAIDKFFINARRLFATGETTAGDPRVYYHQQFNHIRADAIENEKFHPFLTTYFITHYAQYQMRLAANPRFQGATLESTAQFIKEIKLQPTQTTGKNSKSKTALDQTLGLTPQYKQEISLSIQKSLIAWLAKDFSLYSNPDEMIVQFIRLNTNLKDLLAAFGLEFKDIILNNPTSQALLKNMCVNLFLFANPSQKSSLRLLDIYHKSMEITSTVLTNTQVKPINDFLTDFDTITTGYTKTYTVGGFGIQTNIGVGENNQACIDFIKEYCSNLAENGRNTQNLRIAAVKVMARFIDYRIVSYKDAGDKYEKSFYKDHVKDIFARHPDMMPLLKDYKPYVIAQINASLKKIVRKDYSSPERAKSLKACLAAFETDFHAMSEMQINDNGASIWAGFKITDLDENAQAIYTDLEIITLFPEVDATDPESKKSLARIITDYRKTNKLNTADKALLIDILIKHKYYKYNHILGLGYIHEALKENHVDFLAQVNNDPECTAKQFTDAWLYCLGHDFSFNGITFRAQGASIATPLVQYIDEPNDATTHFENLFKNPNFKTTNAAIKTKILSASYPYKNVPKIPMQRYAGNASTISAVLGSITLNDIDNLQGNASMSCTFDPQSWHVYFEKDTVIPGDAKFTALQHLAFDALSLTNKNKQQTLYEIANVLATLPDITREDGTYGYWIETLLVGMHKPSESEKQYVIKEILPLISEAMMAQFEQKGVLAKMLATLQTQSNPLADAPNERATYELYVRFLLEAAIKNKDTKLAEDVAKQFIFYPNMYDTLADKWQNLSGSLQKAIQRGITESTPNALMPPSRKTKLYNVAGKMKTSAWTANDEPYLVAMLASKLVKETLFLSLSAFSTTDVTLNKTSAFDNIQNKNLDANAKEKIYESIQKSIHNSLVNTPNKWRSYEFLVVVLKILDKLAIDLDLDGEKLISNGNLNQIAKNYYWMVEFKDRKDALADLSKFKFISDANKKRTPFENSTQMATFMSALALNAATYQKSSEWNKWGASETNKAYTLKVEEYSLQYAQNNMKPFKNNCFIETMRTIIEYRMDAYTRDKFDKGFYLQGLENPLLELGNTPVVLTPVYADNLFIEILDKLNGLFNSHPQLILNEPERVTSLRQSVLLFATVLGLKDKFENFDYQANGYGRIENFAKSCMAIQPAVKRAVVASSASTPTSNNHSSHSASRSNNNNNSNKGSSPFKTTLTFNQGDDNKL
jgi:hypothetical protein